MLTQAPNATRTGDDTPYRPEREATRNQPSRLRTGHAGFVGVDPQVVLDLPAIIRTRMSCSWARAAAAAGQLLCLAVLVCDTNGRLPDAKRFGSREAGVGYRHELPGGGEAWTASRALLIDAGVLEVDGGGYLVGVAPDVWALLTVPVGDGRYWVPVQRDALRDLRDLLGCRRGDLAARQLYLAVTLATTRGHSHGLVDHNGLLLASLAVLADALNAPVSTLGRVLDDLNACGAIGAPQRRRGNGYVGHDEVRPGRLPDLHRLRAGLTGRVQQPDDATVSPQGVAADVTVLPVHPTPAPPEPAPRGRAARRATTPPPLGPPPQPATAKIGKGMPAVQPRTGPVTATSTSICSPSTRNGAYTRGGKRFYATNCAAVIDVLAPLAEVADGRRVLAAAICQALEAGAPLMALPAGRLTPEQLDLRDRCARTARLLELAASEAPTVLAGIARAEVAPDATHTAVLAWAMTWVAPQLDAARRRRRLHGRSRSASTTATIDVHALLANARVGSTATTATGPAGWVLEVATRLLAAIGRATPTARGLREAVSADHPDWRAVGPAELARRLEADGTARLWGDRADQVLQT